MNQIMGLTYLVKHDVKDERVMGRLLQIDGASRHLLQIINDLLDLSRIEADRIRLEIGDFTLLTLLDRVAGRVREQAARKGIEVVTQVDPTLPAALQGDAMRLDQILGNLLSNAVKFSERGPIVLRARQGEGPEGYLTVRFEVADRGIGMSPEVQAGLFALFHQGDGSSTRRYEGTGLGLALSKRLVALMAGEFGVISAVGQGSTFWFSVRLTVSPASAATPTTAPPTQTIDWARTGKAVALLASVLAEGDVQAQTLYGESVELYEPVLQGRAAAFREALAIYDFEHARHLLQEAAAAIPALAADCL